MSAADVHLIPLDQGWEVRRHGERFPASRHRGTDPATRIALP
jgi:hypothetical protein